MMMIIIIRLTGSGCLHKLDRGVGFCLDQLQLISHNAAFITAVIALINVIMVVIVILINTIIILIIMIIMMIIMIIAESRAEHRGRSDDLAH